MKALITGAGGQLGWALRKTAPADITLHTATHEELDIANPDAVERIFSSLRPDVVLNAAGFTSVDRAEDAPNEAHRTNCTGPRVLAEACAGWHAGLVHVSTSYVFDGTQSNPYGPTAVPRPLNVYGLTKLEGEHIISAVLPKRSAIVRTSWLHGSHGQHFFARMLSLFETRSTVHVVCDQFGTPTSTHGLAATLWALALREAAGTFHWSNAGVASWYEFAVAIGEDACALGILRERPGIMPVTASAHGARARRPARVLLDTAATETYLGTSVPHWRQSLRETLEAIASERALARERDRAGRTWSPGSTS